MSPQIDDGNGHDVDLRDFVLAILNERDRRYEQRWQAQEHDLVLATKEMERRLEHLNELREQVVADRGRYYTREMADERWERVAEDIETLKDFRSRTLGLAIVIGLFSGIVGAMVMHLITGA